MASAGRTRTWRKPATDRFQPGLTHVRSLTRDRFTRWKSRYKYGTFCNRKTFFVWTAASSANGFVKDYAMWRIGGFGTANLGLSAIRSRWLSEFPLTVTRVEPSRLWVTVALVIICWNLRLRHVTAFHSSPLLETMRAGARSGICRRPATVRPGRLTPISAALGTIRLRRVLAPSVFTRRMLLRCAGFCPRRFRPAERHVSM